MSRLLGPLSVITSSVSWRDWALAGDQTAGAGNRLPAATAVIDLRNSRRFMAASARVRWGFAVLVRKAHASAAAGRGSAAKHLCGQGKIRGARSRLGRCTGARAMTA